MELTIAFLVVPAFFVLSFVLLWKSRKRTIESLRRTAAELGYEFIAGEIPSLRSADRGRPAGSGRPAGETPEIFASSAAPARPEQASWAPEPLPETEPQQGWKRVLSYFAPWRIRGREGEESVAIYTVVRGSGKSRTTYTVVEMSASAKAGDFTITKEGFFSKVGKALFALQDIQAGDPDFDAKAMVKGRDPEAVKRLLSSSSLRTAIGCALDAYPGLTISDSKIAYERSGSITRADYFRPLISVMSELARAMREAS